MARYFGARYLVYSLSPLAITAGIVAASTKSFAAAPDIQLQPATPLPRTDFGNQAVFSKNESVLLEAEQIDYQQGGMVIATGKVAVTQGDTILLADQLAYDQEGDLVLAKGNVSMLDPSGNVVFADEVELSKDMKKGVIQHFKARFNDNSLIAAAEAKKIDENKTELFKTIYSPCPCTDEKKKPISPLWSVQANTALIDQDAQKITYDDAYFNVKGIPILYTPYLSHATPGADNKSGFLLPTYSHNNNVGSIIRIPYYYAISPDHDATIIPIFTGQEGLVMAGEYRQLFDTGLLLMEGSATYPERRNVLGDIVDGRQFRGHIDAQARFRPNADYSWGFDLNRTTDDTYLRRYGLGNDTVLTSRLYGEGFDMGLGSRSYASAMALSFQGLTAQDDNNKIPTVFPYMLFSHETKPGWNNSRMTFDANALSLYRDVGDKSRRLATTSGWNLPYLTQNGQIIELRAQVRADGYSVEDVALSNGDVFSGTTGRLVPQVSANWRWPFLTRNDFGSVILEPIAMFAASPGGGNPESIPNEDSVAPEFTDTNLFDPNRYAGYDRIENGPRMSYGLRGQAGIGDEKYADWLIGQNYRTDNSSTFPYTNDLDSFFSDYVGKLGITYDPFSIAYRFRLDKDNYSPKRQEFDANVVYEPVNFSVSYLTLNNDPSLADKEVISASAGITLSKRWQLTLSGSEDLELNQVTGANTGLVFTNECLSFGTYLGRTFTNDRDIEPSTTILFRISLKNLE